MANPVPAAYPFIEVAINTSALQPTATRSPGVIAIAGVSNAGDAAVNAPTVCDTVVDAVTHFGAGTALTKALTVAFLQDPAPSKVYGVKIGNTGAAADVSAALDALAAADDVDFVTLAATVDPTLLVLLKQHAETISAAGSKRMGVAMIDPARAKTATYVADALAAVHPTAPGGTDLMSSLSRMVLVAARGAQYDDGTPADVAAAAVAAIAGQAPATSMVLKPIRGISIPLVSQYTATEITGLSQANIIPIISPSLIVGGGFYFAEARCFTSDATMLYIDIVRVLDDIDFRLKAGLIGLVGDARITRSGLTTIRSTAQGILGPLVRAATIDAFDVQIPLLDTLAIPVASQTATDKNLITTARANRTVDMTVTITYGPAVHQLQVTLQPTF